jgi:hypothetical protein
MELRHVGETVAREPRVIDVLACLMREPFLTSRDRSSRARPPS